VDEFAFPHVNFVGQKISGMTLRDHFAGQVLCGYFANNHRNELEELGLFDTEVCDQIASHAYEVADAMLKARNALRNP
jgi:hypothetical protein